MTDEILFPSTPFNLAPHLILLGRRGSEAHGLHVPSTNPDSIDDRDLMGIVVPPSAYYLGLKQWEGAEGIHGVWDTALYEVRKFIRLLVKQNPNVISLLWTDDEDILVKTSPGNALIVHRDLFRHEKYARDAFAGYAYGQLKKMTAFNREAMETISELEKKLLDYDINLGHAAEGKLSSKNPELQALLTEYTGLRRTYHKAYLGAKRWALVQKTGYDPKNAGHMVRLLHMAHEYLTTGRVNVRRTWDRDMLLEIKAGEWSLEAVQAHATEWFVKVQDCQSVLPTSIDTEKVENLTEAIVTASINLAHQSS